MKRSYSGKGYSPFQVETRVLQKLRVASYSHSESQEPLKTVDKSCMRNVKSCFKLSALGLIFFLASCKSPDVEVSSINKKLPAPQLKSGTQSPFDQDLETQTYVRVQGTCDSRVGDLFLSFNNILWVKPPSIPTYANTTLTGSEVNDINCADGKFDFYLTSTDILANWGVQTNTAGTSGNDVDVIYIKGETLIGETFALVLKDTKTGGNDNGGGPATTVSIEKMAPAGFGTSGQCENFYAYVKNANGYNTTHTSDVSVTISKSLSGSNYTSAEVFDTYADCDAGNSAQSTVLIPAANGMKSFYVKVPTDSGIINKPFAIKIATSTALNPSTTASTMTVRDSSSTGYRYLTVQSPNWRIYKDVCTAFSVNLNKYGYGQWSGDSFSTTMNIESDNSSAKFYSDSSCSTRATSLTIPAYSGSKTFYVKYVKAAAETNDFPSFKFALSSITASDASVSYDYSPIYWNADLTAKSTNTVVSWNQNNFNGSTLQTDYCYSTNLTLVNENFTPIPSSTSVTLNLYNSSGDANAVKFYADNTCSSETTTATIYKSPSDTSPLSANIYFKFNPAGSATSLKLKAMATTGSIVGYSHVYEYERVATMLKILGPSNIVASGQCEPITVMLTDTFISTNYSPAADVGVYLNGSANVHIYSDSICSMANPNLIISAGAGGQTTVYMKVNDMPSNQTLELTPVYMAGPYQTLGYVPYVFTIQP